MADAALDALLACPQAQTAVHTLNTVFLNVLCNEGEERFRRLRRTNAALRAKLLDAPGAEALLAAVGFVEDGEFLVLPAGAVLPEEMVARVCTAQEALGAPAEPAPRGAPAPAPAAGGAGSPPPPSIIDAEGYAARQAAAAKERAEKEAEKAKIRAQLEEDRRERAERDKKRPITGSTACARGAGGFQKLCVWGREHLRTRTYTSPSATHPPPQNFPCTPTPATQRKSGGRRLRVRGRRPP